MNKKIISSVLSLMIVFGSYTVSAHTVFADDTSDTVSSVETVNVQNEMMTDISSDSTAELDLKNTQENTSDIVGGDDGTLLETDISSMTPQEIHKSYRESFLSDFDAVLKAIQKSSDTNEYDCSIVVNILNRKYKESVDRSLNGGLLEEDCECLYDFTEGLFDLIGENVSHVYITDKELETFNVGYNQANSMPQTDATKQRITYGFSMWNLKNDKYEEAPLFEMRGNYLKSPYGNFYIVNPNEIIDYIGENYFGDGVLYQIAGVNKDVSYSKYETQHFDFDNQKYDDETVEIYEKLTFDIRHTQSYKYSFFDFLAEPNEVINCRVVQINRSKADLFVMTMSGSKKTLEFDTAAPGNWGYDGSYNFMDFGPVRITGSADKNNVSSVAVTLHHVGNAVLFSSIPTENMTYEFYYDGNAAAERRAIYKMFGIEKNPVTPQKEPQDPERYVTKMKHSYELSGEQYTIDYYINFVAVLSLDVSSKALPDWYRALGHDVTVTIVGITHTLNGKDRHCYTMVKFAGKSDSVWFDMSSGSHRIDWSKTDYTAEDSLEMKLIYKSLLSFDGTEKIQNTVDNDSFETRIYFSHEDFDIESIEFDFGVVTDKVTADEINYIGGGKDIYAKFM